MITLERGQLQRGARGLDVTVRSAKGCLRPLTPTWDMVKQCMAGTMGEAEYTRRYLAILNRVGLDTWGGLEELGHEFGGLRFLCYCPNRKFCHTHLLINYLLERWPEVYQDGRRPIDVPPEAPQTTVLDISKMETTESTDSD